MYFTKHNNAKYHTYPLFRSCLKEERVNKFYKFVITIEDPFSAVANLSCYLNLGSVPTRDKRNVRTTADCSGPGRFIHVKSPWDTRNFQKPYNEDSVL